MQSESFEECPQPSQDPALHSEQRKETDKGAVVSMRRFLIEAGVLPE